MRAARHQITRAVHAKMTYTLGLETSSVFDRDWSDLSQPVVAAGLSPPRRPSETAFFILDNICIP